MQTLAFPLQFSVCCDSSEELISGTIVRQTGEEYKINNFKSFQFWISATQF